MIGGNGHVIRDLSGKKSYRQDKDKKKWGLNKKIVFLLCFILLVAWLWPFFFSKDDQDKTTQDVETESLQLVEQRVSRKTIYDRNLMELAMSFTVNSIYVKPLEFDDIASTVTQLADVLGLAEQDLLAELKTQRSFKWLVKNISKEKADKVAALDLAGVYFYEQEERFHPKQVHVSHVIGDVTDERGLSGVELFYDNLLHESEGEEALADEIGDAVGKDLVLTLDVAMQKMLEGEMLKLLPKIKNEEAVFLDQTAISALVMGAATGEIFAYAQLPSAGTIRSDTEIGDRILSRQVRTGMLSKLFDVAAAYNEGRGALSSDKVVPEGIHYLRPRKMKKKRVSQQIWWGQFDDGTYGAMWLAKALTDLGQLPGNGHVPLLNGHYAVDLPGQNGGPGTGISLLCSFAGLVNGGQGVSPHFLKAVFSENQGVQEWEWPNTNSEIIELEASRSFVRFLRESVPSSNSVMIAEVLFPPKDYKPVAAEGEQEAGEGVPVEARPPVIENGTMVALAAVPAKKPQLVMLLTVDDGRFDLGQKSLVKRHVNTFMQKAVQQFGKNRNKKISVDSRADREQVIEQWLASRGAIAPRKTVKKKSARKKMADVRGMSLRQALQELEYFETKIVIKGSGRIVRQHPQQGAKIMDDTVIVLQAEAGK